MSKSRNNCVQVAAILVCLVALQVNGLAQVRVLPPTTGETISSAFARLEPDWTLDSGRIDRDRVQAKLCPGSGDADCVVLDLSDGEGECEGTVMGPWCVVARGGFGTLDLGVLLEALSRDSREDVWTQVVDEKSDDGYLGEEPIPAAPDEPSAREHRISVQRWPNTLVAWLVAFLTLLLPGFLGFLLAWAMSKIVRRRLSSWWSLVLICCAPVLLALAVPIFWLDVGFMDWLTLFAAGAVGFALGGHQIPRSWNRKGLVVAGVTALLGVIVLEGVARILPEPSLLFLEADQVPFQMQCEKGIPPDGERALLFYPARFPEWAALRFPAKDRDKKVVLHVGDSMVDGTIVAPAKTFSGVLTALDPGTIHVNLGVTATGTDYQVGLIMNWLKVVKPDMIVLYVFNGNDVFELGQKYPFCNNGPLMDWSDGRPTLRCPEPIWGGKTVDRVLRSPPPFFLRVGASISAFARQLCSAYWRLSVAARLDEEDDEKLAHMRGLLTYLDDTLREAGVPLVVVLLPWRARLEDTTKMQQRLHPELSPEAMGQMFDEIGLRWLNAWEPFEALVAESGTEPWFLNHVPGDVHFSVKGHQFMAEWLLKQGIFPH